METMPLNPWFSMWLHPRRTIRQIVETNPERLVLSLAAVGGFIEGLTNMASDSKGDDMSLRAILLATLIVGPIMGIVGLWVGGFLLRWTGGWIGGQADARRIRATLAWANVPLVWSLLLWIPAILLFGLECLHLSHIREAKHIAAPVADVPAVVLLVPPAARLDLPRL